MSTFISDPAILCRWEHRYSEALIKRGVKNVALLTDGVERVTPPASLVKRTIKSEWENQGKKVVREIEIEPKPTVLKPWSRVIQEDVAHYLRAYSSKGLLKGAHLSANGWSLFNLTEAQAREDEGLREYDAVLCFSDRRIREWIAKDDPHFFDLVGGVHVPDHEPKPAKVKKPAEPRATFGRIRSTNMGTVTAKDVPWLWPGRVPLGMLTIIAGAPGTAKSFVSLYLAGRITTGGIWPDVGKSAPEGVVILLAAEDSVEYTIRKRLDLLGADATKVEKIEMVTTVDGNNEQHFTLTDDLKELEAMVLKTGARLVIIDPLNSYLGGKQDGFKDVEVRRVLDPLKEMAERLGIAVILIMHTKKGLEDEIIYGIGGSVAFPAVARSIFFCTRDPETPGRFYFTHPKINISVEMPPLSYTISPETGVVWGTDPIKLTAREILGAQHQKPGPKQTARQTVKQWLISFLSDGPQPAREGLRQAAELGHGDRTLQRAMKDLGIESKRVRTADGRRVKEHVWSLPARPESQPF
jgi:archaellum biogenesis ATPase FlaH